MRVTPSPAITSRHTPAPSPRNPPVSPPNFPPGGLCPHSALSAPFRVWVTVWVSPHPGGDAPLRTARFSSITNKNQPDLERSELIFCWVLPTALAGKGFEPHDLRVMRCHLSNLYQKMRKFRGFQEVFRVSKGRFSRGSRAVVAPHGSKHESGMGQKMGQPKTGFRRRCRRSGV